MEQELQRHSIGTPGDSRQHRNLREATRGRLHSINSEDLVIGKCIGEGGFGSVYKAKLLGFDVVAKFLNAGSNQMQLDEQVAAKIRAESELQAMKAHKHIVQFYGFCGSYNCMVMEHCANGSLRDLMNNRREHPIIEDLAFRLRCLESVAAAFVFLHRQRPRVIHCDLKPSNVLLDEYYVAKVGDFGLSRYVDILDDFLARRTDSDSGILNLLYQAPEVDQAVGGRLNGFTTMSDVYSFGVLIQELITLNNPYGITSPDFRNIIAVMYAVRDLGRRPTINDDRSSLPGQWDPCVEPIVELMKKCCRDDPNARPGFQKIYQCLRRIREEYENKVRLPTCITKRTPGGFFIGKFFTRWMEGRRDSQSRHPPVAENRCFPFCKMFTRLARKPREVSTVLPDDRIASRNNQSSRMMPNALRTGEALKDYPIPEDWPKFCKALLLELDVFSDPYVASIRHFCQEYKNEETLDPGQWNNIAQCISHSKAKDTKAWKDYQESHNNEPRPAAKSTRSRPVVDPFAPGPSGLTMTQASDHQHINDMAGSSSADEHMFHHRIATAESGEDENPIRPIVSGSAFSVLSASSTGSDARLSHD